MQSRRPTRPINGRFRTDRALTGLPPPARMKPRSGSRRCRMANEEHVALLKRDVEVWNNWRDKTRDITPNLRNADLIGANLTGACLTLTNLSGANLSGANLTRADLT